MYAIPRCQGGAGSFSVCDGHGNCDPFTVIGSSVPISALAGEKAHSLSVHPTKGKRGGGGCCLNRPQGAVEHVGRA